jgi:hypothetical protein
LQRHNVPAQRHGSLPAWLNARPAWLNAPAARINFPGAAQVGNSRHTGPIWAKLIRAAEVDPRGREGCRRLIRAGGRACAARVRPTNGRGM